MSATSIRTRRDRDPGGYGSLKPISEPRVEISVPRRGWVLGVVAFVLLGAMAWWVSTSPLFRMHSLDVVGNHRLSTSRAALSPA